MSLIRQSHSLSNKMNPNRDDVMLIKDRRNYKGVQAEDIMRAVTKFGPVGGVTLISPPESVPLMYSMWAQHRSKIGRQYTLFVLLKSTRPLYQWEAEDVVFTDKVSIDNVWMLAHDTSKYDLDSIIEILAQDSLRNHIVKMEAEEAIEKTYGVVWM